MAPEDSTAAPTRRKREGALLLAGLLLMAFNLRPAVASIPPLLTTLERRLHLAGATVSLVAAMPLLCFGLMSAGASPLSRRFGRDRLLLAGQGVLAAGVVGRALLPRVLLLPGTVVVCCAIAILNVLSGGIVKDRFPNRVGFALSTYSCVLLLGSTVAAGTSALLYTGAGRSFGLALGVWAVPVAVGLAVWSRQVPRALPRADRPPAARLASARLRRDGIAWWVTAFWGLQALVVYTTLSWLPAFFTSRGTTVTHAGLMLGLVGLAGIPTTLAVPRLLASHRHQRLLTVLAALSCATGLVGAWFAPLSVAPVFMVLLGVGQGCTLPLGLVLMVERAGDERVATSVSAMAQGIGYLFTAAGVFVVGLLYHATSSWALPGVLLVVVLAAELVAGYGASVPRTIQPISAAAGE